MKRKILSIIVLGIALSGMAQIFSPDSLKYRILDDRTAEVTGCTAREGIAIIPEKAIIDGKEYTITRIGDGAFTLPEYINYNDYQWSGYSYKEQYGWGFSAVYLPESVTSIGRSAFQDCDRTTFIRLPKGIKEIAVGAFQGCAALGHIDLPTSVTVIGNGAFHNDQGLYTIGTDQLPNLTSVGNSALYGCQKLRQFPLTDKVTTLGASAFAGCRSLQGIHLPQGMTEVPDGLLSGCYAITSLTLPQGVKRIGDYALQSTSITNLTLPQGLTDIGDYAFQYSPLKSIDLSQYQGSIGFGAFMGCQDLQRLTLPKSNPYCYTDDDGKAIFDRESCEATTILPSVENLVMSYPATGTFWKISQHEETVWDYDEEGNPQSHQEMVTDSTACVALDGDFPQLTSLELPCTWLGGAPTWYGGREPMRLYCPALQELIVRTAQPFPVELNRDVDYRADSLNVQVFDYAIDAFKNAYWSSYSSNMEPWRYAKYTAIDRPTERLYLQEVAPMYPGFQMQMGNRINAWNTNWEAQLMEEYPQYFPSTDSLSASYIQYVPEYRQYHFGQYMTSDKIRAYCWEPDTVVQCIDGYLCRSSKFDINDYVNWYLHNDTVFAGTVYTGPDNRGRSIESVGYSTRIETDPSLSIPGNAYWYIQPRSATSSLSFYYAPRMVPGVTYDIYALMAPEMPEKALVDGDSIMAKNKIRIQWTYDDYGTIRNVRSELVEVSYDGTVQPVLLMDSVEVSYDWFNYIQIQSLTTASERKKGYTNSIALVGILAKPRTLIDILPSGVEDVNGMVQRTAVAYYDLQGRRHTQPVRGVNIVRYSDGTTRRMMLK